MGSRHGFPSTQRPGVRSQASKCAQDGVASGRSADSGTGGSGEAIRRGTLPLRTRGRLEQRPHASSCRGPAARTRLSAPPRLLSTRLSRTFSLHLCPMVSTENVKAGSASEQLTSRRRQVHTNCCHRTDPGSLYPPRRARAQLCRQPPGSNPRPTLLLGDLGKRRGCPSPRLRNLLLLSATGTKEMRP